MLSLPYLVVKAQQNFVTSSCMFLDEKAALEIWLYPELNLAIFPRTGPRLSVVPGGGGNPLYQAYRYVPPQRVGFTRPFGLKTGIDFAHFGLESSMVFKGTTGA